MFITRPSFEAWLPAFVGYEGCKGWAAVELAAVLPWFLIHTEPANPSRRSIATTLLVSRLDTLRGFLADLRRSGDQAASILAFYPPQMTSRATWEAKEIQELWEASLPLPEGEHRIWLLKTTAGELLLEPPMRVAAARALPENLLYQRKR